MKIESLTEKEKSILQDALACYVNQGCYATGNRVEAGKLLFEISQTSTDQQAK